MDLSDEESARDRNTENFDNEDGGYRSDEAEEVPSGQNDDDETSKGRRIDPSAPTKKIIRKPQPKLNAERLQGPKGLLDIENCFEGFEFRGPGHEKSDLDGVMKRLEHWAHRLFPKYQFDDFLEKMEVLGSKKNVQVYLKKYRLDMIQPDNPIVDEDNENAEKDEQLISTETPDNEFDKLIAEEIEKQRQVANDSVNTNTSTAGHILGSASTAKPSELTDEIKARIEAKRLLALERKAARLRREEESKKQKLEKINVDSHVFDTIEDFDETEFSMEKSHEKAKKDSAEMINAEDQKKSDNESINDSMRKEVARNIVSSEIAGVIKYGERTRENEKTQFSKNSSFAEEAQKNVAPKYAVEKAIPEVPAKQKDKLATDKDVENAILEIDAMDDYGKRKYYENRQEREMTMEEMDEYIMSIEENTKVTSAENVPVEEKEKENHDVDISVAEVQVYDVESSNLTKTDRKVYGKPKDTDYNMTREELLMEIDSAMEEIISRKLAQ